jgi:DNA-binding response OmpR family regulator
MIRLGLIAAQASHLERLQNAFQADPEFQITELTQPSTPDVLVIDLADQPVRQPQFWITLHGFYPTAALMGVLEAPIDLAALQAALQAGAQYLITWIEPTDRWRAVARAAFHRAGSLFQGELQEAVWALMDDWAAHEPGRIHIGALELDLLRGQAILAGQPLKLSPLRFKVLAYLVQNAGRLISHEELLHEVWQVSDGAYTQTEQVQSCLKRLGRKLNSDRSVPTYLVSQWGQGHRLRTDAEWRECALTMKQLV